MYSKVTIKSDTKEDKSAAFPVLGEGIFIILTPLIWVYHSYLIRVQFASDSITLPSETVVWITFLYIGLPSIHSPIIRSSVE